MSLQHCWTCGAHGDGIEIMSECRYDPKKRVVWRTYQITHTNGTVHTFETPNVPLDDKRWRYKTR